jgi:hypothetical protein
VSMLVSKAKKLVYDYASAHLEKTDSTSFTLEDVYVVWFAKTLQNWKALVSTTLPDGTYYEVTSNGDKGEIYLDVYKKFDNIVINDTVTKAPTTQAGPHSRTCKIGPHAHGSQCHVSCPTCHGLARF